MTKRGFTYIELGAVIVLVMMLSAAIMPRFASLVRAQRLTNFRDGLPGFVGLARESAIIKGQAMDLQYDENERRMQIVAVDSQDSNGDAVEAMNAPEGVEVAAKRSLDSDNDTVSWSVRFFPDGTASNAAIQFNVAGETYSLIVDAKGGGKTADGEMPEAEQADWEAGDYVRRTQ